MVAPFVKSPLGGNLGARTGSFYRLDPTGTVPIEFLADLIPALEPDRVTIDAIESETSEQAYLVTTNALQDFTAATSNNHRDLRRISVSGILISSIDLGLVGSVGIGGVPGLGGGLRSDLIKIDNLEAMAAKREPIMYVSPRLSMPLAFIESIGRSWSPDLGDNTQVTISLVEARIVNPLLGEATQPDLEASATGNNAAVDVGPQGGVPVNPQQVLISDVLGVAPTVLGVL